MKKSILLIALALIAGQAQAAAPLIYICKDHGKKLPLTVDDVKNVLTWKGTAYKITVTDCGKYGWRAERDGVGFDFCTATQGVADFELNGVSIYCDQKR